MAEILAVTAALITGFSAGLFSFRIKSRWCPACGGTLTCPCANHQQRRHSREASWTRSN